MQDEMIPLSVNDTFRFSCSAKVPCFNECCRDLNQFLTPYDILRLKNRLGISSGVFLERCTTQHTGPESGFPVVTLKTSQSSELRCPFVTPRGCSVYEDRPSSCRTYPLARMASRSRETGSITEQYVLIKEAHCLGFQQDKVWTAQEWIKDQGAEIYNEMNDMLMEIISLKNRFRPGPLDMKSRHFFHTACYDLDAFRTQTDNLNIDADTLALIKSSDVELLKFGIQWVRQMLFGKQ